MCNPGGVSEYPACLYACAAVNWFENKVNQFTAARTPYETRAAQSRPRCAQLEPMDRLSRLLLITSFVIPTFGKGQDMFFKTFDKIRAGVSNSIEFEYSGKYDSINFQFQDRKCSYEGKIVNVSPARLGKDTLFAQVFKSGKLVYQTHYILECEPIKVFGAFNSNLDRKISVPYLNASKAVIVYAQVTYNHWEGIEIKSYRITFLRSGSVLYTSYEVDWRYSDSTVHAVRDLKKGDLIVISEILPKSSDAGLMRSVPTVYEIE